MKPHPRHTLVGMHSYTDGAIDDADAEHVQFGRRKITRVVCEILSTTNIIMTMIAATWRRVAYCDVAKAASSSWKLALAQINGLQDDPGSVYSRGDAEKFGYRQDYIWIGNMHKYEDYRSLMFVRNPFTRLLSVYLDKFMGVNRFSRHYQIRHDRKIIEKYRPNATEESLRGGRDVKFNESVKYAVSYSNEPEKMDVHWKPQYSCCNPCQFSFNYIGKVETMRVDMKYVTRHFYKETIQNIPQRNIGSRVESVSKYYRSFGR